MNLLLVKKTILCFDIKKTKKCITLDQTHYVNSLNIVITKEQNTYTEFFYNIQLENYTQPDISFDVCSLAANLKM